MRKPIDPLVEDAYTQSMASDDPNNEHSGNNCAQNQYLTDYLMTFLMPNHFNDQEKQDIAIKYVESIYDDSDFFVDDVFNNSQRMH